MSRKNIIQTFRSAFKSNPSHIIHVPGRVNLIGEHTDYNEGFVLPMAVNLSLQVATQARADEKVQIYSDDFRNKKYFLLKQFQSKKQDSWMRYVKGIAHVFQTKGFHLQGFDAVMSGTIPRGAGLSSSAALELAIAYAFSLSSNITWQPTAMALLAQQAENTWVGVQCGIMDQMVIAHGQANHAILIDCRSLAITPVRLPDDITIIIMYTRTRRGLVSSEYNARRQLCEEAARLLKVRALRDISLEEWKKVEETLSLNCRLKAKHVITENDRVLKAVDAMQRNDKITLGQLFYESHCSLRDDYQVSNPQLDAIVECARQHPACYGARMTGAGFGGCAIALVAAKQEQVFKQEVACCYKLQTGLLPKMYVTRAVDGARAEEVAY